MSVRTIYPARGAGCAVIMKNFSCAFIWLKYRGNVKLMNHSIFKDIFTPSLKGFNEYFFYPRYFIFYSRRTALFTLQKLSSHLNKHTFVLIFMISIPDYKQKDNFQDIEDLQYHLHGHFSIFSQS